MSADSGATTVLRAYGVLAAILDNAVKDRRVNANPARGVNLPRKVGKRRVYLSHDQVQTLADSAGQNGTLVLFLAYAGLRRGEATALRIRDIDTLRRRVLVSENAVDVSGTIIVGTPKSHVTRSVPYPAFLSLPIAALCQGKDRDALLFGDGHSHMHLPHSLRGWFASAVRKSQAADPTFSRLTIRHATHGCEPRNLGRRECEGGAADARSRLRRDDARHVRGPVR
ncbi:hypothetical protein [Subtercola sp. YIM 133946]|uniref:hypothetical protein n=1 Tax=Subtercola sp. YIM 133946 TaxID=3118909 RepID=UPI002F9429FD